MKDQKNIKNVILDLGGVLVDIDPENTYSEFKRILKPDVNISLNWDELPEIVVAMETGKWTKEDFKTTLQKSCKDGVSDSQIVDAWCAMLHEFRAIRVKLLQDLAERYNLYLLSNTNVYHVHYFEKEFKNRYHFPLKKLFKKIYYSHEIGFRKPDAKAFEFVLENSKLNASETVMVDDRQDNCDAAIAAGLSAIKVPENTGLEAIIKELL
ncbi:MAG: HAD family phosphatase [Prolixibacteraceae bacterium]|jgi:HAD superfamily hydrolase (TIGR01509 family)|nr:HAD family phosphatase [Prolixibacteraceae bacterium]